MLLKQLVILNCRRIKQAVIEFYGPGVQVILGPNKSGKTTIAQSIAIALGGSKAVTPGMITVGEEKAEIIAETDDGLEIHTTIKDKTTQSVLRLDTETGRYVKVSGGVREFIDSLRSGLEMPWSMKDWTDAKIIELLKGKTGIGQKIATIDIRIKNLEEQRTQCGRDKNNLGIPDAVAEAKHPESIDVILEDKKAKQKLLQDVQDKYKVVEQSLLSEIGIKDILGFDTLIKSIQLYKKDMLDFLKGITVPTQDDIDAIDAKIADWHKLEQTAVAYDAYVKHVEKVEKLDAEYESFTDKIETARIERKKVLASMAVGVKGLEITEDGQLLHNGILRGITETNKVSNWSTAESIQVFFGLGACFAGALKMLIVDNAESLDKKTTDVISTWAERNCFLVVLLKVAEIPEELEDNIIYIKEGEVCKK